LNVLKFFLTFLPSMDLFASYTNWW